MKNYWNHQISPPLLSMSDLCWPDMQLDYKGENGGVFFLYSENFLFLNLFDLRLNFNNSTYFICNKFRSYDSHFFDGLEDVNLLFNFELFKKNADGDEGTCTASTIPTNAVTHASIFRNLLCCTCYEDANKICLKSFSEIRRYSY